MRAILFAMFLCIIFCRKNKYPKRLEMANKTIHKMKEQFKNNLLKNSSKPKPKDYWSLEEYKEYDSPYYDDPLWDKDASPPNDPLWKEDDDPLWKEDDDPLWKEDDDPLWKDDPLWDDSDNVSGQEEDRGQCGLGARRGSQVTLILRFDNPVERDAIHINCGAGACIGQVQFSSCHTGGTFRP